MYLICQRIATAIDVAIGGLEVKPKSIHIVRSNVSSCLKWDGVAVKLLHMDVLLWLDADLGLDGHLKDACNAGIVVHVGIDYVDDRFTNIDVNDSGRGWFQ